MAPTVDPRRAAEILLSGLGLELVSCTELQTLWAGYGHVCAIKARPSNPEQLPPGLEPVPDSGAVPLILKLISPPHVRSNENMDEGHLRKMLSYEVEQRFYQHVAPQLPGHDMAVAKCLVSTADPRLLRDVPNAAQLDGVTATIMADLRPEFPVAGEKRGVLSPRQVHAALDWLARFHGTTRSKLASRHTDRLDVDLAEYLQPPLEEARRRRDGSNGTPGSKLWLNGGYTYLATRRKEYQSLERDGYSEWSAAFCTKTPSKTGASVAEMAAAFLTPTGRSFESYIHGDVKSENLFTTEQEDRVAFFDFQYVGLGLGVCDLAKLFTCSVPMEMLVGTDETDMPEMLEMGAGEKELLERYRQTFLDTTRISDAVLAYDDWALFVRHWETALVDWCRFQASWGFWGNTEWLEARVRSILADEGWRTWLGKEV